MFTYSIQLMSIRKNIAAGLIVAAKAVAEDKTKERAQKWIHDSRVKLAKAIEPKAELDTKWMDDLLGLNK